MRAIQPIKPEPGLSLLPGLKLFCFSFRFCSNKESGWLLSIFEVNNSFSAFRFISSGTSIFADVWNVSGYLFEPVSVISVLTGIFSCVIFPLDVNVKDRVILVAKVFLLSSRIYDLISSFNSINLFATLSFNAGSGVSRSKIIGIMETMF